MFFVSGTYESPKFVARSYLIADCSRGTIRIEKKYEWCRGEFLSTPLWEWKVNFKRAGKPTLPFKENLAFGSASTLYRATQSALQRLFSQRKQPVYQLMNMLVKDQVMYELAHLGD